MFPRRTLLPALLTLLLLSAACGPTPRQHTAAMLDDVETYINDRPDSALAVLRGVDTTRIHSDRGFAKYYLLLGIALDKNNVDDGAFIPQLTRSANWFAAHGSPMDQIRAYYYLGDQQKDAGAISEASVNFSRALDLAEKQQDYFFAGMAARNLSDLFRLSFDYPQALEYAQKSVAAFKAAEMPAHTLYSQLMLASGYHNIGHFKECLSLCDSLLNERSTYQDKAILCKILACSASAFIHEDPPQPDSTLSRFHQLQRYSKLSVQDQAIYAWAQFLSGDARDASAALKQAYALANSRQDSVLVMPWDARIAEKMKDSGRLTRLQRTLLDYTNQQVQASILRTVDRSRAEYYQQQEINLTHTMEQEQSKAIIVLFAALIVIACLIFSLRMRKIRAQQHAREQQARLDEQTKANAILSNKLNLYGTTVEETLDFGFDVLNRLSDAYYHPNTAKEPVFREIIEKYITDISSRTRLGDSIETNINIIHDDVLSKLREEVPDLKEEDIKLFSFCVFGFSYKAINAFYPKSTSLNTSYSRVFRLRKAIEKSGSKYTQFFLSFLEKEGLRNKHSSPDK